MRVIFLILYSVLLSLIGLLYIFKKIFPVVVTKQRNIEKYREMFLTMIDWIKQRQRGKNISNFLRKNAYHSIAIYGLADIGQILIEELKNQVEIKYGIDRNDIQAEYPVYKLEDNLPEVDMIIVTALYDFDEIEEKLKRKLNCPVYSIEDIVCFMC